MNTTPRKYVKRPVTIEAMRYYPLTAAEVTAWCPDATPGNCGTLIIHTLEGNMIATPGDWIIKGVHGEYYPCKPDIFAETYQEAE